MLLWVTLRRPPMTRALTDLGVCVLGRDIVETFWKVYRQVIHARVY